MEITIQTSSGVLAPPLDRAFATAEKLLTEHRRADSEVSVLLTSDEQIHQLNRQWRGYDKPTDVLSWPQEDAPFAGSENSVLGDVAISLPTAARQAQARQWELADEVALLLVHGILHLLGYEDETEAGAEQMRQIETAILGKPLEKTEAPL